MHKIDQKNLKKFLNQKNRSIKILDVGCGLGNNIELIQSWGFKNVYGTDISPKMVEECIKKELNVVLDKDLNESDFDIF